MGKALVAKGLRSIMGVEVLKEAIGASQTASLTINLSERASRSSLVILMCARASNHQMAVEVAVSEPDKDMQTIWNESALTITVNREAKTVIGNMGLWGAISVELMVIVPA